MRRITIILLAVALILSMAACGGKETVMTEEEIQEETETGMSIEEKYQVALQEYELGNFEEASSLFYEFNELIDCSKDEIDAAIELYNADNEDEARRLYPNASL